MTISSAWAGRAARPWQRKCWLPASLGSGPRELRSQGLIGGPEATNRDCDVLIAVAQARILVVVKQGQAVSVELTILCSTPEIRALAREVEKALAAAAARWENRETKGIHAIAIFTPFNHGF